MADINLEFSGNILRALKLNESKEVVLKKEFSLSFNINDETQTKKNKDDFAEEFEECINNLYEDDMPELQTAGILISTEQTFLNVTPIDFNEDSNAINSHILWELSNYFPETYKDFNIKYYRLNNNYLNENIDDVLLIAVNKNILEFIKDLCESCDIKIKNVEIDHFAFEKSLKESYPEENKDKSILVIGCRERRFDYSLIVNELLKNYNYDVIEGSNFKNLLIHQINKFNSLLYNIDKIYLYGDENTESAKILLEQQFRNTPVCVMDLFGKREDTKFTPLYGLALKNLE